MAVIPLNVNVSRRELRQFAGIWFPAFFVLVGGFALHWGGSLSAVGAIWVVVASISVVGFFVPRFIRPIFVGWMYAVYPIGWVISHLIMAAIYYLVMTPIGLLIRAMGREPFQRRADPSLPTYWIVRRTDDRMESYLRQF